MTQIPLLFIYSKLKGNQSIKDTSRDLPTKMFILVLFIIIKRPT